MTDTNELLEALRTMEGIKVTVRKMTETPVDQRTDEFYETVLQLSVTYDELQRKVDDLIAGLPNGKAFVAWLSSRF